MGWVGHWGLQGRQKGCGLRRLRGENTFLYSAFGRVIVRVEIVAKGVLETKRSMKIGYLSYHPNLGPFHRSQTIHLVELDTT